MIERITKFSDDRVYRYSLWRNIQGEQQTNDDKFVMFNGLNPSTADETQDDPTIRRCKDFTSRWGYSWLLMTNIFAFRETDPEVMKKSPEPIGSENDDILLTHALDAAIVICAWGKHGKHLFRGLRVKRMLISQGVELKCLKINGDKSPQHPLYIPAITLPIPFPLT